MKMNGIRVIAFDADDTLWDNQSFYDRAEDAYCSLLSDVAPADAVRSSLYGVEQRNMASMGYGTKAFVLSLMENALEMGGGMLRPQVMQEILKLGHDLLQLPAKPMDGVEETLRALRMSGRFGLVVFTKGDLLDQENKLRRSGLWPMFDNVVVVSEKSEEEFRALCRRMQCRAAELLMVGNSFKSDVHPALSMGAWAAYVPFKRLWQYEHFDEYPHSRMAKLNAFSDLKGLLL